MLTYANIADTLEKAFETMENSLKTSSYLKQMDAKAREQYTDDWACLTADNLVPCKESDLLSVLVSSKQLEELDLKAIIEDNGTEDMTIYDLIQWNIRHELYEMTRLWISKVFHSDMTNK